MEVAYRRLTAADLGLFDRVEDGLFDMPIEPERLADYLADPGHHLIVAVSRDRVVGKISAVLHKRPDKASELAIDEVVVAPGFRRQGIGRGLLSAMMKLGARLDCDEAWLATDLRNGAARALYEPRASYGDPFLIYVFSIDKP